MFTLKLLAQPKFLLTGFTSFQGAFYNPTEVLMNYFKKNPVSGIEMKTLILNVAFGEARKALQRTILSFKPDVVLSFGMTWVPQINIERYAINLSNGTDNNGKNRDNQPVVEGAPLYYAATIPVRNIQYGLKLMEIPVKLNDKPTQYVCNDTFFHTRHFIEEENLPTQSGFIHIPPTYIKNRNSQKRIYAVEKKEYKKMAMNMDTVVLASKIMIDVIGQKLPGRQ